MANQHERTLPEISSEWARHRSSGPDLALTLQTGGRSQRNAMVVRPKNGSIEKRFLEYLFRGGIDLSRAITGAAQPTDTRTNLAPIEFSYPALISEQRRITAKDGELGNQHLRDFQDNEKTTPTILTTSQKLSTGVDARNIRNIVLMRPINSMIEFKQIIGAAPAFRRQGLLHNLRLREGISSLQRPGMGRSAAGA